MKITILLIICLTWLHSEARPKKFNVEVGQPFSIILQTARCVRKNDRRGKSFRQRVNDLKDYQKTCLWV